MAAAAAAAAAVAAAAVAVGKSKGRRTTDDRRKSQTQAVILLVNTQINKYTNEHCRTVPIRWCLLCICFFSVVLLAPGPHKCANAQMHK